MPQYFVKPPYPMVVNGAHPLSTGLNMCVHYNDLPGSSRDVVSQRLPTNTLTSQVIGEHGRAIKFTGSGASVSDYGFFQPIQGIGACTVMVLADPIAQATMQAVFAQRAGAFQQMDLIFNYNNGSAASGNLGVFQNNGTTYNASSASGAIIGGYHWYGFTSGGCVAAGGAVTRLYRDGILLLTGSNTATATSPVVTSQLTSIGALAGYTAGFQYNNSVAAVFVWTRELSPAEVKSFVADPWALLTTNDLADWWYLQAGAAASDGTFSINGLGAANFAGASLNSTAFSTAGLGASSFTGASLHSAAFATAGVGAVGFVGGSLASTTLNAAGSAVVTFASSGSALSSYSIAGTASASFASSVIASGSVSSSGAATAAFSSAALHSASFASNGTGAASFVSAAGGVFSATFTSNGAAAFNAVGEAQAAGTYSSGANATVGFISQSLFSSTFSIAGAGTVNAVGASSAAGSVFAITGTGTLSAIGQALARSAFSANGLSNVSWASPFTGAGSILDGRRKLFVAPERRKAVVSAERRVLKVWLK